MAYLPSAHHFSVTEQRVLSIIPHFTAPLSILGSGLIIRDVIRYNDERVMYHKLLFGMSCFDLIASCSFAFSTLPMPKQTIDAWSPLGTTGTCRAQGFFIQTSLGTVVFNASLSIYYLLVGRYQWSEQRMKRIEKWMLATPAALACGTAFAALAMNLFNSAALWCWIAPRPPECSISSSKECQFELVACPFRWSLFYGPLWVCIATAMVSMTLVYWTVLQQERAVDAYQYDGQMNRERSKRVAKQALFYILAFYVSWLPATIYSLLELLINSDVVVSEQTQFTLALTVVFFTPMQGFLNFLVYFRAKYNLYRREHPEASVMDSIKKAAFKPNVKAKAAISLPETKEDKSMNTD